MKPALAGGAILLNIIPNPMKVTVPNLVKDIEKENRVLTFASICGIVVV